jgi:hypothetical protein
VFIPRVFKQARDNPQLMRYPVSILVGAITVLKKVRVEPNLLCVLSPETAIPIAPLGVRNWYDRVESRPFVR